MARRHRAIRYKSSLVPRGVYPERSLGRLFATIPCRSQHANTRTSSITPWKKLQLAQIMQGLNTKSY